MTDLMSGPSMTGAGDGSPPPPAWTIPPPLQPNPFWSRASTWLVLTVLVVGLSVGYFVWSTGVFASAAGGCGGG